MTAVRLASAPINWGIETPLDPDNPDPDDLLQSSRQAGYAGCEIGPMGYFGDDADEVSARFDVAGLLPVAAWVDLPLAEPLSTDNEMFLELVSRHLGTLGADFLIVSDLLIPERLEVVGRVERFPDVIWGAREWSTVASTLDRIRSITSKHGTGWALHPHVGGHIETESEIAQLMHLLEGTDSTICLDTGHMLIGGADPLQVFRDFPDRVSHLHAKDVEPGLLAALRVGSISYRDAVGEGLYCDLGSGIVDWNGFRSVVRENEYAGWVVAEQDRLLSPGDQAPYESNAHNFFFLDQLLR